MTITCDPRSTKFDPIASHRYVRPIVQEISPVAPASIALEARRRVTAARRPSPAAATELQRIVTAAAAGDSEAITKLIKRFAPRVRAVARAHRLSAHDAEDVTQTTWLRLLESLRTIRDARAVGAWLETTARRESLRILKKNGRERPTNNELVFDAPVAPADEQPGHVPEHCATALGVALQQLPRRQHALLSMLFADPSPGYTEVSRALGMPIGSIGPTRARSLARLRENQALSNMLEESLLDAL